MDIDEIRVIISGDASDLEKTIRGVEKELEGLEKAQKGVSSATQEATKSEQAYGDTVSNTGDKITDYTQKTQKQTQENNRHKRSLKDIGKGYTDLGKGIDQVAKPLYVTSTALAVGGVAAAKFAIDFEDSFAGVKKTVEGTPEQLDKIKQDIIDMSTVGINGHNAIPLTTKELNELAAAGGQLGIQTENIANFTETMAMMGTATNLSGEQGAATLARFMNVMQVGQDQISNIGSTIVDLGNNSATTEAEIAEMALRMGKFGNTVGMGAADVLGYSAALSSMGVEAQAGGSAVGRTWLAIEEAVASGGKDLQAFAKYSGMSAKEFQKQWSTDPKGAFNGLLKGLQAADNLTLALDEIGVDNTLDKTAMQALVNGFDLVEKSVDRANKAYKENTALQNEFNAKSETTASQLAVTKNNIVEAARSFGEVMLPTLKDVTGGVAGFAKGLAGMSDSSKKTVMGVAGGVIALGAATKGLSGGIKFIGNTADGLSKIKTAFSAGGVFAKFAPTLMSIASATGPVALGVAGIGAAALTTKAIYDKWYKDNYKFSDGLSEQTQIMTKARNEWKTLNDLRWEYNDLTDKINNKSLKGEELEGAKSRLDEIAKILKEEYKIDVDSGDIDEAIKKAQELAKYNAKRSETQLQREFNDLTPKYEKAINELPKLQQKYNEAQAAAKKYRDTKSDIADIDQDYAYSDHSEQSQAEYIEKLTKAMKDAGVTDFERHLVNLKDKSLAAAMATSMLNGKISALGEDEYKSKIDDYTAAIEQYKQTAESLANVNLDNFAEAIKAGADGEKYLTRISEYAKRGLIDADEYAKKAALIKSGQESLNAVFEQGDASINSFVTDYVGKMKLFGASNEQTQAGLQKMSGLYTDFLHKSEQLPKDQVIRITAEGDIEKIQIVDDKLKELIKKNKVDIKFNVDTGGFDINDLNGNKLGEITVDGTVNWVTGTTEKPEPQQTTVDYMKGNQESPTKDNAPVYYDYGGQDDPEDRTAKVWYVAANSVGGGILANRFINNATGTDYFPGGLAMVNDQKGISDPRELIVDKGRAFIPEGRDVVLPLSKGAKVYTAKQTKAIMERMGIPHYAGGKDNSEAFTNARDEWQHYTRTHAVTTTQELEKWVELSKQFKDNQKDIWDIEEQIFSLTQKQMQERYRQSEKWLAHEEKYNGMSTDDYLDGIDRMRAYTEEYYQKGILSHSEYIEKKTELDEKYIDKFREGLDKQLEASMKFADEHTYFNDWNEIAGGDDPFEAFRRVHDREIQAVNENKQLWEDAQKHISDFGSALFQGRFSQSKRWLDEQVKYFDMSDDEYIAGLKRMQKYTQDYLNAGIIGRREYSEAMTEINHMLWDKQEEMVTDALQKQREAIDEMRQQFSDQEQAIRDSWTVADRKDSIAELSEKVRLYTGAVTERGKEQLKQYQEQLKQAQREEELYQLQQKNNAVINDMEKQYKLAEDNKKVLLRGIRADIVSAQGAVNSIVSSVENRNNGTEKLLKEIKNAINNVNVRGNTTNYIDSRTQTTTNYNSTPLPAIGSIAFGNWNVSFG